MALRLRFSLGTLVLSVLLLGAIAAFYWNWQEWLPVRTHTFDQRIDGVNFSPTGKYYFVSASRNFTDHTGGSNWEHAVVIHDAATGDIVATTRVEANGLYSAGFCGNDHYYSVARNTRGKDGLPNTMDFIKMALAHLIDLETREDLVKQNPELSYFEARVHSSDGRRTVVHDIRNDTHFIADFPTFANRVPLDSVGGGAWVLGGSSSEYFLIRDGDSIKCFSSDGALVRSVSLLADSSVRGSTAGLKRHAHVRNSRLFVCGPDGLAVCDLKRGAPDKHLDLDVSYSNMSQDGTRLLYLDQPKNLHWYHLDSGEDKILSARHGNPVPGLAGDSACSIGDDNRAWDLRTGNLILDFASLKGTKRWSSIDQSRIAYADDAEQKRIKVFDYRSNQSLGEISRFRCFRELPDDGYMTAFSAKGHYNAAFAPGRHAMVFITKNSDSGAAYSVFRLNMANRWRGLPTMPEFWIAVLILAALIWNVRRNRRNIPKSTDRTDSAHLPDRK